MQFTVALNYLLKGTKLRRLHWSDRMWIESNGSDVYIKCINKENIVTRIAKYCNTDKAFTLNDITANDWEIKQ